MKTDSRMVTQINPTVTAVSRSSSHMFSKSAEDRIRLLAGLGVEGDAHLGPRVQHRSRVARDPSQPNLRQVHLLHAELHDELRQAGFTVGAGQMGENITRWLRDNASIEIVDGVASEYLAAAAKSTKGDELAAFEANVRSLYKQMARITIAPTWARYYDFGAGRLPTFLHRLLDSGPN